MAVRRKKTSSAGNRGGVKKKRNSNTGDNRTQKHSAGKGKSTVVTSKNSEKKQPVTIILDPVITLSEVASLKEKFLEYVGAEQIQIDASKVEHIDTGGLQFLLAFIMACRKQGGQIKWLGKSTSYINTAKLLGLARTLDISE